MSVSCNTGRGYCLPALFMFCWNFQSLYLTRLLGLSCPGRETRIFPCRERKWGSSRILPCDLQCVTRDDPILSILAGAVHKQRRWGKSLQGWQCLSVLGKAVEGWCGNVGTWFLPPAVFQNNRATEATPVLCALNGLYSRNLNVGNTALPPPGTCFLAQEPTECSRSHSQLFNDKPNAFVLERRLRFLSFQAVWGWFLQLRNVFGSSYVRERHDRW